METFITIVGTIASVVGAIVSWKQAGRASSIAKDVEKKLRKNRRTSELSKLNDRLEIAIQEIKIFSPVSSAAKLRGVDHLKTAENVQEFILALSANLSLFAGANRQKADSLCRKTRELLDSFCADGASLDERKENGKKILGELSNFSSVMKVNLSKHVENS